VAAVAVVELSNGCRVIKKLSGLGASVEIGSPTPDFIYIISISYTTCSLGRVLCRKMLSLTLVTMGIDEKRHK
jgi:hypothetical protein